MFSSIIVSLDANSMVLEAFFTINLLSSGTATYGTDYNGPSAVIIPAGNLQASVNYVPVADNDTAENRSKNRRTRIVVLPKLDQFYDLIEQGMKAAGN